MISATLWCPDGSMNWTKIIPTSLPMKRSAVSGPCMSAGTRSTSLCRNGFMETTLFQCGNASGRTTTVIIHATLPVILKWSSHSLNDTNLHSRFIESMCGRCGMLMPEEWGGPGLDTLSYVLMIEEVARVCTAMSTALGVTNSAVQIPLLQFGTDAQKQKYLKRLASGEILGSFCLTEAAAGSDAAGITT